METAHFAPLLSATDFICCLVVAQAEFPRGSGFYFSMVRLFFLAAAFLAWVFVCNAVQKDSDEADMQAQLWNSLLLGAGVIGLLVVWILGSVWLALLGLTLITITAVIAYSFHRDSYAPVPFWQQIKQMFGADSEKRH